MSSKLIPMVESAALPTADTIAHVMLHGDLSGLTPGQLVAYYRSVCASLRLNPLTKPFAFLKLDGKLVLYARKDCAEQLRLLHSVSLTVARAELVDTSYAVWVTATLPSGRTDADVGIVDLGRSTGDIRANAMMKAVTKAKRRCTLSLCGLGMLDESEVGSIDTAVPVDVNLETGEVLTPPVARRATKRRDPDNPAIDERQRRRLFATAREWAWPTDALKQMLKAKFGVHSSTQIKQRVFDKVIAAIEQGPPADPAPAGAGGA
jgi:hypothetical protein